MRDSWISPKFQRLSKAAPNAQTLWLYLLTGPCLTAIPGVIATGRAGLAEELGWDLGDFDRCFNELEREQMVVAEWEHRLVYVVDAFEQKANRPTSTSSVVAWRRKLDVLPECDLLHRIEAEIRLMLLDFDPKFLKCFDEARRIDLCKRDNSKEPAAGSPAARPATSPGVERCNEADEEALAAGPPATLSANEECLTHSKDFPEEAPEEDPEKGQIPPVVPPRGDHVMSSPPGNEHDWRLETDAASLQQTLSLAPTTPTLPGKPRRAAKRLVDRWREPAEEVLAALNAARARIRASARGIRPSYESLGHIAERLEAGKTVDDCLHVVAVCEAECRQFERDGEGQDPFRWFDAVSPFRRDNFERKLAGDPRRPSPTSPRRPRGGLPLSSSISDEDRAYIRDELGWR